MNCFVIMPFSEEFDDVYATIKSSVERAIAAKEGRCFRLDETRPAGRITEAANQHARSTAAADGSRYYCSAWERQHQAQRGERAGWRLAQMRDLKSMVAQAVTSWNPGTQTPAEAIATHDVLANLEGAWVNQESGSHLYAKVVDGDLIVPYCYGGNAKRVFWLEEKWRVLVCTLHLAQRSQWRVCVHEA